MSLLALEALPDHGVKPCLHRGELAPPGQVDPLACIEVGGAGLNATLIVGPTCRELRHHRRRRVTPLGDGVHHGPHRLVFPRPLEIVQLPNRDRLPPVGNHVIPSRATLIAAARECPSDPRSVPPPVGAD